MDQLRIVAHISLYVNHQHCHYIVTKFSSIVDSLPLALSDVWNPGITLLCAFTSVYCFCDTISYGMMYVISTMLIHLNN